MFATPPAHTVCRLTALALAAILCAAGAAAIALIDGSCAQAAPEAVKAGDAKAGDAKASDARTPAAKASDAKTAEAPPASAEEVGERLNKRVKAEFTDVPLQDVVDFIGEAAGVNTFIDWKALADAGVERDAKVSLKLRFPVSAGQALKLALRSVSPALNYSVDGEVVIIEKADGDHPAPVELQTKAYNVEDIAPSEEAGNALVGVITDMVTPDDWKAKGGQAKITRVGTRLLVVAPEGTHDALNELLDMLRDAPGAEDKKDDNGDNKMGGDQK